MITYFIVLEQSKLSNVSTLEKETCGDDIDDFINDSATDSFTPTWRDFKYVAYDLLIIGSFGKMSDSQTIQVAHKLAPNDQEGSSQWMTKEIDLIREIFKASPRRHLELVCSDLPGTEHSKDYYLEKIRNFLTDCKQDKGKRDISLMKYNFIINYLAIIWYTGHGEKNTGNWCFKDGVITFQDIFGLYMNHFRGKQLNIDSDCSYSGNWIKDCVKTLDDLGIPSCGHCTREQGILLKMFCSCGTNEESTALCYITEANKFDETNEGIFTSPNKILSSGQTTKCGDFAKIRCSKKVSETCEIDSTYTWEDRILKGDRLYLVRIKNKNKNIQKWQYVLADEEPIKIYQSPGIINNAEALYSGLKENPPKDIIHQVNLRFWSVDQEY